MMTEIPSSAISSQKPARSEPSTPGQRSPQIAVPVAPQLVRDLNLVKTEAPPREKPKQDDIQQAIEQLNQSVQAVQRDILFTKDRETGMDVIKVIDQKTHEVILQIPPEEVVNLAKKMDEVRGMLFAKKA